MIQKIQNKPGSNLNFENELKNSEVYRLYFKNNDLFEIQKKNSELFKEKKELLLLLEKLHQDNNELQKELNLKNNMSNRHVSNPLSNNNVDFNDLSEIQLLSNMILLFSKYKNNQLEEKTRLIIEKYLKETQKNYFQSLEISIKELNGKYYSILEKFKNRVIFF